MTFTPTDSTDYTTTTATATINVAQATPTISSPNPANIVYGTALGSTQLDATASVAGTFTYTPASGTYSKAGNGETLSRDIHADRHDRLHTRHRHGDDQRAQATPRSPGPTRRTSLTARQMGGTQLDATANVAGIFTYAPARARCLKAGNGQTLS